MSLDDDDDDDRLLPPLAVFMGTCLSFELVLEVVLTAIS